MAGPATANQHAPAVVLDLVLWLGLGALLVGCNGATDAGPAVAGTSGITFQGIFAKTARNRRRERPMQGHGSSTDEAGASVARGE